MLYLKNVFYAVHIKLSYYVIHKKQCVYADTDGPWPSRLYLFVKLQCHRYRFPAVTSLDSFCKNVKINNIIQLTFFHHLYFLSFHFLSSSTPFSTPKSCLQPDTLEKIDHFFLGNSNNKWLRPAPRDCTP